MIKRSMDFGFKVGLGLYFENWTHSFRLIKEHNSSKLYIDPETFSKVKPMDQVSKRGFLIGVLIDVFLQINYISYECLKTLTIHLHSLEFLSCYSVIL